METKPFILAKLRRIRRLCNPVLSVMATVCVCKAVSGVHLGISTRLGWIYPRLSFATAPPRRFPLRAARSRLGWRRGGGVWFGSRWGGRCGWLRFRWLGRLVWVGSCFRRDAKTPRGLDSGISMAATHPPQLSKCVRGICFEAMNLLMPKMQISDNTIFRHPEVPGIELISAGDISGAGLCLDIWFLWS